MDSVQSPTDFYIESLDKDLVLMVFLLIDRMAEVLTDVPGPHPSFSRPAALSVIGEDSTVGLDLPGCSVCRFRLR